MECAGHASPLVRRRKIFEWSEFFLPDSLRTSFDKCLSLFGVWIFVGKFFEVLKAGVSALRGKFF